MPLDVVSTVIKNRLKENDCNGGYILDGFPRSLQQAQSLDNILDELNKGISKEDIEAIYFDIPNEVLIERLVNRRSCPKCGKIYNLKTSAPKTEGKCDDCNTDLIQRKDDTKETAVLRFETYEKETKPLLEFYTKETAVLRFETYEKETKPLLEFYTKRGNLKKINANQSIDNVWKDLLKVIEIKETV